MGAWRRVTLSHVTSGAGGHGGKRATQPVRLPSAAPQRLGPPGGGHPQRLEELLAVGGQGPGGAPRLPRGGGGGAQHPDAAAGERGAGRGDPRAGRGAPSGPPGSRGPPRAPLSARSLQPREPQWTRHAQAVTPAPQRGRRSQRHTLGSALVTCQVARSVSAQTGLGPGRPGRQRGAMRAPAWESTPPGSSASRPGSAPQTRGVPALTLPGQAVAREFTSSGSGGPAGRRIPPGVCWSICQGDGDSLRNY